MTVRTVNFTRRRRIRRGDLDFVILTTNLGEYTFDAKMRLDGYKLPKSSRVFVEAYRQTHWMRFDFGTVEKLNPPPSKLLSIFDSVDGVLFRVRVASDTSGLLLAEADRIPFRAKDEKFQRRIPLLPVVPEDLVDEVCKVSYEVRGPELVVNSSLGSWRSLARNPVVAALIYPFVLRDILTRIAIQEDQFDRDDKGDWRSRWCRFAELLPGMEMFPEGRDDREEWVDKAVRSFSRRIAVLSKFGQYWKEGSVQ